MNRKPRRIESIKVTKDNNINGRGEAYFQGNEILLKGCLSMGLFRPL